MSNTLASRNIPGTFNGVFLGELIAYGAVTILFLFYFNRVIALVISAFINSYTWTFYRVRVHIHAIQFSPLAGRIFLKGVRYHGQNETICIHDGYITWRYWFRRVAEPDAKVARGRTAGAAGDLGSSEDGVAGGRENGSAATQKRPCRVHANLRGLEWFVYNRKPAYDSVLATLVDQTGAGANEAGPKESRADTSSSSQRPETRGSLAATQRASRDVGRRKRRDRSDSSSTTSADPSDTAPAELPTLPKFLDLFPIGIACSKAAMVMGNEHTRSVLVAKFESVEGRIDARAAGPLDPYRQSFDFTATGATAAFRHNHGYQENQLAAGARIRREREGGGLEEFKTSWLAAIRANLAEARATLEDLRFFPRWSSDSVASDESKRRRSAPTRRRPTGASAQEQWTGLSRYLVQDEDPTVAQERWRSVEYARTESIFDVPKLQISFYWDVPGAVPPSDGQASRKTATAPLDRINGSPGPAYGLDVILGGGTVNYGPWADRQRANIQSVFFPATYATTKSAQTLNVGDSRISTVFNISFILDEEVVLRVHTKEPSKDIKWNGQLENILETMARDRESTRGRSKKGAKAALNPEVRPAGWIELALAKDTSVRYDMDMLPGVSGYRNAIQADGRNIRVTSSVNHDVFLRTASLQLKCDLSNPLHWNSLHQWSFDVNSPGFELFMLRDHAFLLTDLVNDWTSGPPGSFFEFVPFVYRLDLHLPGFKLYLNVNDANIINSATSVDDNSFLVINGKDIDAAIEIPLKSFQPAHNKVGFDVDAGQMAVDLIVPSWSTQRAFLQDNRVATLDSLGLRGSYTYYSATSPALTDTVLLEINGSRPRFTLFGFLVRYFMNFKDNYFGDYLHFQTQEEFQSKIEAAGHPNHQLEQSLKDDRPTNDLDVILVVAASDAEILLPSQLYSADQHVAIGVASISLDLRFTNYYMDMQVDFSPLALSHQSVKSCDSSTGSDHNEVQIFIDGAAVVGHRLFGLPRSEPTYVCNWDFAIGQVLGEGNISLLSALLGAVRSFTSGFKDSENALRRLHPIVEYDVVFLRAVVQPITLWMHVGDSAFLLDVSQTKVSLNDWAGEYYSECLKVSVPRVVVACVDGRHASRNRSRDNSDIPTHALVQTSVELLLLEAKPHFERERSIQQAHIALHDSRTKRTPWLLRPGIKQDDQTPAPTLSQLHPPTMPFPPMPDPLHRPLSRLATAGSQPSLLRSTNTASSQQKPRLKLSRQHTSQQRSYTPSVLGLGIVNSAQELTMPPNAASAPGPETHQGRYAPSADLALSSAYDVPYFPLLAVTPSSDDLPVITDRECEENEQTAELADPDEFPLERHGKTLTLFVNFETGVRAIFTPQATANIALLMSSLASQHPVNTLDELQAGAVKHEETKKQSDQPHIFQLRLILPVAKLRLLHRIDSNGPVSTQSHQYDLCMEQLQITLQDRLAAQSTMNGQAVCLNLRSVLVTAESKELDATAALVSLYIQGVSTWATKEATARGHLHIEDVKLSSPNQDTSGLAPLVSKTVRLVAESVELFSEIADLQKTRLAHMVHHLIVNSDRIPEAPFTTTTSFVLRTSSFHPRNSDSWKMVCRLRWIWQGLTASEQSNIISTPIESQWPDSFAELKSEVLAAYISWRGWDLLDPSKSSFIEEVFGHDLQESQVPGTGLLPLSFSVSLSRLTTAIHPEPGTNEIVLQSFRTAISRQYEQSEEQELTEQWKVQVTAAKTSLSVNWDIVEILEGIQEGIARPKPTPGRLTGPEGPKAKTTGSMPTGIQLVIGSDDFTARVETLNIQALCSTERFASSVSLDLNNGQVSDVFVILRTETIKHEISSKGSPVLRCTLVQPVIHVSQQRESVDKSGLGVWKAGGLCKDIELNIEQDILGLLGVIDRVVSEELHHLSKIQLSQEKASADSPSAANSILDNPSIQLHLGLLLESYTLSTKLLSSLEYVLKGQTARSTCHYSPQAKPNATVDFDLGSQDHIFVNLDSGETHEIARLSLPPLNGDVQATTEEKAVTVMVRLALEQIVLDASAIHALFSTYSRQELSSFRQDLSRDLRVLKANFGSISTDRKQQVKKEIQAPPLKSKSLMYRAVFSAAGLKIKARTGKSSVYSARLTFDLGYVNFQVDNKDPDGGALTIPELTAKIQMIRIILKRSDGDLRYHCGDFSIGGTFRGTTRLNEDEVRVRSYEVTTTDLDINIYPETASTIVDIIGYLQQRFKSFNLSEEINTLTVRARRMRSKSRSMVVAAAEERAKEAAKSLSTTLFSSMYSLQMNHIQVAWHVGENPQLSAIEEPEDLVFSLTQVKLATQKTNSARLILEDLQLQMAPQAQPKRGRSKNSALLPEVVFNAAYLSTEHDRRLAFQAAGKSLDLRLTSQCILSAANLAKSIGLATHDLRKVIADWNASFVREEQYNKNVLGNKRLSSVLVAADFAGATVHIQGKDRAQQATQSPSDDPGTDPQPRGGSTRVVELQAPGIALKLEYTKPETEDPSLSIETRVNASSNTLHPTVVPLFLEMSESLKEVMGSQKENTESPATPSRTTDGDVLANADPAAILGRTRLNLGLRISEQHFGLTCHPIARVAANARFEDIYVSINTVQAPDQSRFFSITSSIVALQCSLQHVYSREPTGSFSIERIDLSLINSKHISNANGVSAILKVSPMSLNINAKQMQDFFLFRAVWLPTDAGGLTATSPKKEHKENVFGVQRYQQVAATGAFPWNASIVISKLDASVDLGQALGKSAFSISNLWVSSKKTSDWEQNLCLGFDQIGMDGTGRMSSSVQLRTFRLQTSIHWPEVMRNTDHTPLVEASMFFGGLSAKLAFDYQAVAITDLSGLDFLMYNVRDPSHASGDRLVCFVTGDKVHAFCTTQSSAQMLALYQAITRLIQEKRAAYELSLKDVEKLMHRRSSASQTNLATLASLTSPEESKTLDLIPRQLQTNVVVSLGAVKVGAYPRTFFDQQIFKVEALDASAHFSVRTEQGGRLRSGLGMSLGQVRVALSNLTQRVERKAFEEMAVAEVVDYSTGSRGGTILKVPQLLAEMQTWQDRGSFHIDYLFRSAFEGKVEVGWNYSRISYIRGMWGSHARALAQRLGRPLPQSAVRISGGLPPDTSDQEAQEAAGGPAPAPDAHDGSKEGDGAKGAAKITAVVNVPLSRYDYTPVEPPVIVTPQLRDMGEATPPLEWIGLQRERLPNLTHQVVIVPLLEVAKEVEDAYVRILGGS